MAFELFTIELPNGRDELERLNRFLAMHRVVSTQRQMVTRDGIPYLVFCLEYVPSAEPQPSPSPKQDSREKKDVWQTLPPDDRAIYGKLRELRNELAEAEHVRAFVIFTNEQLAEMVKRRVTTLEAMAEIPDIGKSRLEKYCPIFSAAAISLARSRTWRGRVCPMARRSGSGRANVAKCMKAA